MIAIDKTLVSDDLGDICFACDLSAHAELITWAERIDAASFPSPEMPVLLAEPALQLMTFVETDLAAATRADPTFIPTRYLSTRAAVRLVLAPAGAGAGPAAGAATGAVWIGASASAGMGAGIVACESNAAAAAAAILMDVLRERARLAPRSVRLG